MLLFLRILKQEFLSYARLVPKTKQMMSVDLVAAVLQSLL